MSEKINNSIRGTEIENNIPEYSFDLTECFSNVPVVGQPIIDSAKLSFERIERMLYSAPAFFEYIKANIPEQAFQAILSGEQKKKIATGALKLMTKKDGSLMANLINPQSKKVVSTISLEKVNTVPNLSEAMSNYAMQMQMAQIAEQIQDVQIAIEEVRRGQENDRLATAYSCQQQLLQAMKIKNSELRTEALLRITADAEYSRNLLMLSQKENIDFIKNEPEKTWMKIISGSNNKEINLRMDKIRDGLLVINMVSLAEAIAYQELGENAAARESLDYYATYIQDAFLSVDGFVERLDSIDTSPNNYWSKILPKIENNIKMLPCSSEVKEIGEKKDETESL